MSIKLLATDLDGTLIGDSDGFVLYSEFRKRLHNLSRIYDTIWVVCTGRSLRSFEYVFAPLKTMGLSPEYIITEHAYIYRRLRSGRYRPHYLWNFMIRYHIWASQLYIKQAIDSWYRMINDTVRGVSTVYHRRNRLCLRFESEEEAAVVADILREKVKEFKYLRVFRFIQEVDVRMVPFTKGLALEELANRLKIGKSMILTIGNGHNDISMLDGEAAKFTGCPANAETDVMSVVHECGGHISRDKMLAGVIDVIDAVVDNSVDSSLPEWWKSNSQVSNPRTAGRTVSPSKKPKIRSNKKLVPTLIVLMIIYSVLLVFSTFGVLPYSGIIQKPFTMLIDLIVKMTLFL